MTEQQVAPPLVVVGASAGGVEALRDLAAGLPADFPAAVLVVLHIPAGATSALPSILGRAGVLPARSAVHGQRLRAGEILVAPPDHHLVVDRDRVVLTHGPHENGHRPAVDVLFRSAARSCDGRVVAVVLSGSLDDGAAGMVAVTSQGGVGIVQAFDEALYPGMPTAAARAAHVDLVRTVAEMPSLLLDLLRDVPAVPAADPSDLMEMEADMSELDPDAVHHLDRPGVPAGFGCPDCAGALYQIDDGELLRFRCRVGHAWSSESLLERQGTTLESALWMALRSLEEKGALNAELGRRALARGHDRSATRFTQNSEAALEAAELVRRLLDDLAGRAGLTTESAKLDDPDGER